MVGQIASGWPVGVRQVSSSTATEVSSSASDLYAVFVPCRRYTPDGTVHRSNLRSGFIFGLHDAWPFRLWRRQIALHLDLFVKSDRCIGVTTVGSQTHVFISYLGFSPTNLYSSPDKRVKAEFRRSISRTHPLRGRVRIRHYAVVRAGGIGPGDFVSSIDAQERKKRN
jgi:hypothetical protein